MATLGAKSFASLALIVCGTLVSLLSKIVYQIQSENRHGQKKGFEKPWAMVLNMFVGMAICLPFTFCIKDTEHKTEDEALLEEYRPRKKRSETTKRLMILCPTAFDLVATAFMNVGLLYVTASVYQMMRGAEMLFAALFAVQFLHQRLTRLHYGALLCCVAGISMVGGATLLEGHATAAGAQGPSQALLGMGLIVVSQAVQAGQLTFESFFLSDLDLSPLTLVSWEGLYGTLLTGGLLLPALQWLPGPEGGGTHEDTLDSLHMIRASAALGVVLAVSCVALALYNLAGMMVTDELGSIHRSVLETMRTLFVWLLDLGLFYSGVGGGRLGEPWNRYSFLQAAGFVVLAAGTILYGHADARLQQAQDARKRWRRALTPFKATLNFASAVSDAGRRRGLPLPSAHDTPPPPADA